MVEILQRHCQISSFVFAAGWMASDHLPLPVWANLRVSPEMPRSHTLHSGITEFNQPSTKGVLLCRFKLFLSATSSSRPMRSANSHPPTFNSDYNVIKRATGGDLGEEDWKENDNALRTGLRLLSSYRSSGGVTFWIITERDRSATTLLMPDDY
jgi:hypothetical protein